MSQNTTAMQCGAGGETTGANDMTTRQPEALRLAEILEGGYSLAWLYERGGYEVSAELRRQHALIAELESRLEAIGAGGVSGPLIGQPQAMPDLSQLTERGAKAWAGVDAQGLREGFTAADMATVSAQGFRDGVASLTAQAADSVLEDAARYRFLRDGEWRDTDLEPFIRLQLNTLWDAKIDAARKQGEKQ